MQSSSASASTGRTRLLDRLPPEARAIAVLVALSFVVLLPGLLLGPHQDAGIFVTVGEQLARGHLPYRDAWDHKPPGVYVIAAVASVLPGPTWPAFWSVAVAWLAATGVVLRRIVGLPLAAIAVVCMGLYPAAAGGGETETFAALPIAVAFLLAVRARWFGAGVAAGIALTFSIQSVPLLAALAVLAGIRPWRIALGALGVTLVAAVLVAALAGSGILGDAVDAVVVYNRFYLTSDRTGDLPLAYHMAFVLMPFAMALPFTSLGRLDRADAAATTWLIVAAVFIATQGRLWAHYVIPLAIPLALLARTPFTKRPALVAVIVATLVMTIGSGLVAVAESPGHRGRIGSLVGDWVRQHTRPDETILDWGVDAGIYVASEREPAGRYPYDLPLVTHTYTTSAKIAAWVSALESAPPRFVIDSEAANTYWAEGADFLRPPPPGAAGGRDLDLLEPLRTFVKRNYQLVTEIAGRKVYELAAK